MVFCPLALLPGSPAGEYISLHSRYVVQQIVAATSLEHSLEARNQEAVTAAFLSQIT